MAATGSSGAADPANAVISAAIVEWLRRDTQAIWARCWYPATSSGAATARAAAAAVAQLAPGDHQPGRPGDAGQEQ
jgi:hypothetical protein